MIAMRKANVKLFRAGCSARGFTSKGINTVDLMLQRGVLKRASSQIDTGTKPPATVHQIDSPENPWLRKFPWDDQVDQLLSSKFRIRTGFQELQRETVNAAIAGHCVFLVKSTGGGKSLTYQLPALVNSMEHRTHAPLSQSYPGLTIVVSPLLALMGDQDLALSQLKIPSLMLNSTVGKRAGAAGLRQLERLYKPTTRNKDGRSSVANKSKGECEEPPLMLLTSPERMMTHPELMHTVRELNQTQLLQRFVFDEAHCILEWGQSFRKSYKELCLLIASDFPNVPWTCVTATASPSERAQICELLGAPPTWKLGDEMIVPHSVDLKLANSKRRTVQLSASVDRPNLVFRVNEKRGKQGESIMDAVEALLDAAERITQADGTDGNSTLGVDDTSTISIPTSLVYSMYKRDSDEVADTLKSMGITAEAYHSGITARKRHKILNRWLNGEISVICATPAFGMGVNHPSCRIVIHHSMPLSLTSYLQQTGRAGRDGRLAICTLLFHNSDIFRGRALVERTDSVATSKDSDLVAIDDVVSYIRSPGCRRVYLSSYMDSKIDLVQLDSKSQCDGCNCTVSEAIIPESKAVPVWKPNQSAKQRAYSKQNRSQSRWSDSILQDEFDDSGNVDGRNAKHSRQKISQIQIEHADEFGDLSSSNFDEVDPAVLFQRMKAEGKRVGVRVPSRKVIKKVLEMEPESVEELASFNGFDEIMAEHWGKYFVR